MEQIGKVHQMYGVPVINFWRCFIYNTLQSLKFIRETLLRVLLQFTTSTLLVASTDQVEEKWHYLGARVPM